MNEIAVKEKNPNKFTFAFGLSVAALVAAVIEMLFNVMAYNPLDGYGWLFPIIIVAPIVTAVVVGIRHNRHSWFDYLLIGLLLAVWIATGLQLLFGRPVPRGPGMIPCAEYRFPCLIDLYMVQRETGAELADGVWTKNATAYSFEFLVALVSCIVFGVLFIMNKVNAKKSKTA